MSDTVRRRALGWLAASMLLGCSFRALAQVHFDLAAQPLGRALTEFAAQANVNIYFDPPQVQGLQARALKADLSLDEALVRLLAGTSLRAVHVDEHTIRIIGSTEHTSANSESPAERPNGSSSSTAPSDGAREGKKNSSDGFRVAQVDQGKTARNMAVSEEDTRKPEEIVVTAQKREERLQDVPVPVAAISAERLLEQNQLRLQDYFTSIPGLSMTPADTRGFPILTIRGITTGGSINPTVGITIDDVPYGSTTSLGGGYGVPDIDPSDLARVEELRGPQGTLYGASSIGGLLKFVTVDPSTDRVSGRIQAGISGVQNGAQTGYNVRAAANAPLSDTIAIRASGFTRQDPGYVDNIETGQRGINKMDVSGGRLSALWRASNDVTLKLSALFQDTKAYGSSEVDLGPGLQSLEQSFVRDTGRYERKVQAYSATMTAKLAGVDLTALSGYSINTVSDTLDLTPRYGPFTQYGVPSIGFNGYGVPGTPAPEHNKTDKFTQEIRLSAPIGERIEWLLGLFYDHESSRFDENVQAADPATGIPIGALIDLDFPTTYEEYALFGDLTYHVTDRFDVQLGGRESENKQTYSEVDAGPLVPFFFGTPSPVVDPELHTKDNSFTYLITPRLKMSSDLMVYARLASGYRPGGPNAETAGLGVPSGYGPDKTSSYELGAKGDVLHHTLSFDASVYYIAWRDVQVLVTSPLTGGSYITNAGRAKSQGVELSADSRPLQGLKITAWVAWNDAELTEPFPPHSQTYAASGDRLPYSSRFSGNFSLEQNFPLGRGVTGFVGGAVSYVGDREGVFPSIYTPTQRQNLPGYASMDLRAGARYDSWTTSFFVNNVADRRGVLSGGLGTFNPAAFYYIQPRTLGLSLSTEF